MNYSSFLEFAFIALILVISPGPNLALITKTLSHLGAKHSVANIIGLCAGTFVHGALAISGVSIILNNSPKVYFGIKVLGAMYLMFLGIKTIISAIKQKIAISRNFNDSKKLLEKNYKATYQGSFLEGFLTQLLNPKVFVFYLAVSPQFIYSSDSYFHSFMLILIHAGILSFWFSGVTSLYHKIVQALGRSGVVIKGVQIMMGIVLFYFGIIMLSVQ